MDIPWITKEKTRKLHCAATLDVSPRTDFPGLHRTSSTGQVLRIEIRSTLLQRCQEGIKEALLRLAGTPQQLLGISLKQREGVQAALRCGGGELGKG